MPEENYERISLFRFLSILDSLIRNIYHSICLFPFQGKSVIKHEEHDFIQQMMIIFSRNSMQTYYLFWKRVVNE